jgi:DNA-binding winged helix-turn-helix (wHTH) protein/TolB-like protein/tetratricopeptide (TPR) repeat protein
VVRFGLFELELRASELRRRGVKVRLADQPFQILQVLLEHPGEVVTRDELRQRLWPADTFVEFDLSLNSAVRKLRDALGDSAEQPRFVETLPRRGYRFIAPVERARNGGLEVPASPSEVPTTFPAVPATEPAASAAADPTGDVVARNTAGRTGGSHLWKAAALIALLGAALVAVAWPRTGAPAVPTIHGIVVLPFKNLIGETAPDYFVDWVTEDVITEFQRLGSARVIAYSTSERYRDTNKTRSKIAGELKVDGVLEAVVGWSKGHVRIDAWLTHAPTDQVIWRDSFQSETKDVQALAVQVVRAIASAVGPSAPSDPLSPVREVDPEAWEQFINGMKTMRTSDEFLTAAKYFNRAIFIQPDFVKAHLGLAQAWMQQLFGGPKVPDEILPDVETHANIALKLDSTLSDAYMILARTRRVYGDHSAAETAAQRVLRLSPSSAESLRLRAYLASRDGQLDKALMWAEQVQDIDPLSVAGAVLVVNLLRATDQTSRAIEELQSLRLHLNPSLSVFQFQMGITHVLERDMKGAIEQFEPIARSTANQRFRAYLAYAYAMDGQSQKARDILRDLLALRQRQYVSSFGIALIYDGLGEKASALEALHRASSEHAVEFTQLLQYPKFSTLAGEPRYQELMYVNRGML